MNNFFGVRLKELYLGLYYLLNDTRIVIFGLKPTKTLEMNERRTEDQYYSLKRDKTLNITNQFTF